MLISVLFYLFFVNGNCRELYLNTVLESQNHNHYFLVTKARVDNNEREIVVMNYNLYNYLKSIDKKFSNATYYKGELKKRLNNQESVVIGKDGIKKMQGFYVNEDTAVTATAAKGKEYFISHFFYISEQNTYARLKHDIADEKVAQIIKTLFEWNYFVGIVEGEITIINKKFCEK